VCVENVAGVSVLKLARFLCVENAPGVRVFGVYVCANGTSACLLKMFWMSSGKNARCIALGNAAENKK
jgi:hypothetical protein